jgi:hypothetical protein
MWSADASNERRAPLFPGTPGLRLGEVTRGGASMAFADALGRQTRRVLPA